MNHLEKYATIFFNVELNVLHARLKGFIPVEKFREVVNMSIDVMSTANSHKYLVDLSELEVISPENQEYIKAHWFPNAIRYNVRYAAFVRPKSMFGKVTGEKASQVENSPIEIQYFDTLNEAVEWLNVKSPQNAAAAVPR